MPPLNTFSPHGALDQAGEGHFLARAAPGAPSQPVSWQAHQQTEPDTISAQVNVQFMDMLNAYRPSGGLLGAQEATTRCKCGSGTDVDALAGWIIGRKLVSFEWSSRIWLPLFQFNLHDMSRLSGLEEVLSELVSVYDDWEIANWFARPNAWLVDCLPSETLATNAPQVLQAARAERYMIAG
jgi:hypothetical protein